MAKTLIFVVFVALFCSSCFAANWYVSPIGNDANNGTSTSSPVRTVYKAYSVSKTGDSILLMPGLYTGSSNMVTFADTRIIQSQDPNSKAVLNGGGGTCMQAFANYNTNIRVTFMDLIFTACTDGITASAYSSTSSVLNVVVDGVAFESLTNRGIYFYPYGGGVLNVTRSSFTNCGTGISAAVTTSSTTTIAISFSSFSNTKIGTTIGTASSSSSGTVAINACNFIGYNSSDSGLVINQKSTTLTVNDSEFRTYGAAAVDITTVYDLNFNNVTFFGNYNTGLKLTNIGTGLISNSVFQSNNGTNGGAIYMIGNVNTLLGTNSVYFFNNQATNGGAAYISGATLNVQFSTISNNNATAGGDFFCAAGGKVYEYSCNSFGNTGSNGGCGL